MAWSYNFVRYIFSCVTSHQDTNKSVKYIIFVCNKKYILTPEHHHNHHTLG